MKRFNRKNFVLRMVGMAGILAGIGLTTGCNAVGGLGEDLQTWSGTDGQSQQGQTAPARPTSDNPYR